MYDTASCTRRVLTLRDESCIKKMLALLTHQFAALEDLAYERKAPLPKLDLEAFDSMMLNLRCSISQAEKRLSGVHEVHASILGRVLVVTGEVRDRYTIELIDRISTPHAGSWSAVRALVGIPDSPDLALDELS